MRTKELIVGATLLMSAALAAAVGTSSATLAQGYYGYHHNWYGHRHRGLYNYYGGYSQPDVTRGGPGPRVQGGSGMGVGAER
jgi:hypothetical protein